jgi:hypothetical protein
MAPKTPSKTTQVTEVKLPAWVDAASQENYQLAKELGSKPFEQYQGDRVADTSAATKSAYDYFNKNVGGSQGTYDQAKAGYNDASGIFNQIGQSADALKGTNVNSGDVVSKDVVAKMLGGMDLSQYMNPYIDNVETKALDSLDRTRTNAINANSSAAAAAKAFGGSRHGITDAVTNAEASREAGILSAGLRKDAFDAATGLATADINRQLSTDFANRDSTLAAQTGNRNAALQADLANQKNVLDTFLAQTGAKSNAAQGILSSASGIGQIGQAEQDAKMKDFAGLMQMGQQQQMQSQAQIDADREKFDEARNYDLENLNLRLSALGMSPYGKTETTNKTTSAGSSGTDFGQMGMGLFSMLLGLSEDDTKTDKEKVGKVPGTDLDLWAYRYKKDPKTYPKTVGVMASDVEKKMPDAVHKVDGKRVINYGVIGEMMARHG